MGFISSADATIHRNQNYNMIDTDTIIQRTNATAWMLRARELEAELATARVHIAQARAEAAHERLMRSRLAAEIAAQSTNHNDRTEPRAA